MLAVLWVVNTLVYFDRGSVSVVLEPWQNQNLTSNSFQDGLVGGGYMGGYILASGVFSQLIKRWEPFYATAIGLSIWIGANVLTGFAFDFVVLLAARILSGAGEASFVIIAAPFIDVMAPEASRSKYLGVFFCAIPVGYGLGFMLGGSWLHTNIAGDYWTWRCIYFFEAAMMLPFLLFFTKVKSTDFLIDGKPFSFSTRDDTPIENFSGSTNSLASPKSTFQQQIGRLIMNSPFMLLCLGYAAQTFSIGGFAFFGVKYLEDEFDMNSADAGFYMGVLSGVTGIGGTFLGGFLLDRLIKAQQSENPAGQYNVLNGLEDLQEAHQVVVATRFVTMLAAIAAPLGLCTFIFPSAVNFFVFLGLAEMMLFITLSPVNSALLWVLPLADRPLGIAFTTLCIHCLGDAISPAIIGEIQKDTDNWNKAMFVGALPLIVSAILWAVAIKSAINAMNRKQLAQAGRI